jgi:hypothetical protein
MEASKQLENAAAAATTDRQASAAVVTDPVTASVHAGPHPAMQALRSDFDSATPQGHSPLGSSTTPYGRPNPTRTEQGA